MRNIKNNDQAISQVISVLLVLSIVVGSISGILLWGLPYIDQQKMKSQEQTIVNNFEIFDNTIANLIVEGEGSKGVCSISSIDSTGITTISEKTDRMIISYTYEEEYDFTIQNLEDEGTESFDLHMQPSSDTWQDTSYSYRRKYFFNHTYFDESQNDIAVLLDIYDIDVAASQDPKVKFYEGGNQRNFEIELFDKPNEHLIVWVFLDELKGSDQNEDSVLYMYYYGDPFYPETTAVWNNNYVGVWHLNNDDCDDSTATSTCTPVDQATASEDGYIAGAFEFDGDGDYIDCGVDIGFSNSLTIEAMIKFQQNGQGVIVSKGQQYTLYVGSNNKLTFAYDSDGDSDYDVSVTYDDILLTYGRWYYVAAVFDDTKSSVSLYVNNYYPVEEDTLPSLNSYPAEDLYIGSNPDSAGVGSDFKGLIDEVRISDTARSDEYILSSYNTIISNGVYEKQTEMQNDDDDGVPVFEDAKIYLLNNPTIQENSVSYYQEIYEKQTQDIEAAVSFTAQETTLESAFVYVGFYGDISLSNELVVSIYPDSGGDPGGTAEGSVTIQKSEITQSGAWIECDFDPDLTLILDDTYWIVLSTDMAGDDSHYFYWSLYDKDDFYDPVPVSKINEGTGWGSDVTSNYGTFKHRLEYSTDAPPTIDDVEYWNSYYWYTNVEYELEITATDDNNDVEFFIDWGDGSTEGWTSSVASGVGKKVSHIWSDVGIYDIVLSVRDTSANENNICTDDFIFYQKKFLEGLILPNDYDSAYPKTPTITFDGANSKNTFNNFNLESDDTLSGTVLIDLFEYGSAVPIARIWIFDLASISNSVDYGSGKQSVVYENGCILTDGPTGSDIKNEPAFFDSENAVALRIIQFDVETSRSLTGSGKHGINIDTKYNYNRDRPTSLLNYYFDDDYVYNLKFQFYGDYTNLWLSYFKRMYDFSDDELITDENTIKYNPEGKKLVLDNSILSVELSHRS